MQTIFGEVAPPVLRGSNKRPHDTGCEAIQLCWRHRHSAGTKNNARLAIAQMHAWAHGHSTVQSIEQNNKNNRVVRGMVQTSDAQKRQMVMNTTTMVLAAARYKRNNQILARR